MNSQVRKNIKRGMRVSIVQKQHQRTDILTDGVVAKILTNSAKHPHGIKVQLMSGKIGRVKEIRSAMDSVNADQ